MDREVDVVAQNEAGRRLFDEGRFDEARALFLSAAADPAALGAALNVGQCDLRAGRPHEAEACARRLIEASNGFAPAWALLGEAMAAIERNTEAADAFRHALAIAPTNGLLWGRLGDVQQRDKELEAARESYIRALHETPDAVGILASLVAIKRVLCDWNRLDQLSTALRETVREGRGAVQPLSFLGEGDDAAEQRLCATAWVEQRVRTSPTPSRIKTTKGSPRIGFVSYGFGAHPTAILASAMIEAMRAQGVDLHLICTGPNDASGYRRRLEATAPIHDVEHLSSQACAQRIRDLGIDVLVDLDGYSRERVPSVFAERPCALQLVWLGFPGTTGASCFDYVIADGFVLPPELEPQFTERVARLPRCYQPNDPTRRVPAPPSREALGLPADAVVYACFNTSFKLNPRSFARMMKVLREVPGSVLWLLKAPGRAAERLRATASALGVAPERLVFLEKQAHGAYLAAYTHADLFLDTEHYNAHTTASDAMWAGCPVLTRPGRTFASRVAGSLNHHAGLDELNVTDDRAFVGLAVRVGLDPGYRAGLRARLGAARTASPLFDAKGFALDFMALVRSLLAREHVAPN
jgi:predicted O-linked N-acetylglucosamine transferase (SPINDLY family)